MEDFDFNIGEEVEIIDTKDFWEGKIGTILSVEEDIALVKINLDEDKSIIQEVNVNNLIKKE